ncbi:MAG: protein kinase [Acidobacteriota bacterium]
MEEDRRGLSTPVVRTLLFSDLVGSTHMVEQLGDVRSAHLFARHDRTARDLLLLHGGREIDKTDGFLLLFERPFDAVLYAADYHRALDQLSAEERTPLKARVGIHLGEVILRENTPEDVRRGAKPLEVEGIAKPVAARVMSLALGGQTLLTTAAFDLARRSAVGEKGDAASLGWTAHGRYVLKGVEEPMEIFEVGIEGASPMTPPPDSEKARRVHEEDAILGWRPAAGIPLPQRKSWIIQRKLGEGGFGEVWLARHSKTGVTNVFKFCFEEDKLRALRREVALLRLLKDALGDRDDIARVIDWEFQSPPYYLETEYSSGGSIEEWTAQQGGLATIPLDTKIDLVAQVAEALSAAHSVGVLHKDVKPANVLVRTTADGRPRIQLTDFGIGRVTDREQLAQRGITIMGMTEIADASTGSTSGTRLYMAPELLEGKPSTVQADVFALGVILYQMLVTDLHRALAPGWERDIPDELLREDVALAVDGSPERRIHSTAEFAERLRNLETRRAQRLEERRRREVEEATRNALAKARRRRRLMMVVAAASLAFGSLMTWQARRISQEAARAERAQAAKSLDHRAEAMESLARTAALLPLHDVVREREHIRRIIGLVQETLEANPQLAGPANAALGRGHYALGDIENARSHLEKAWSDGYREPDVAYSLGLALGAVYQRQRAAARWIENAELRDQRIREIDETIRKPALEFLKIGSTSELASRNYAEALIHYYAEQFDEAHDEALAALKSMPWLFEARYLAGASRLRQAFDAMERGDWSRADTCLTEANACFDLVREAARSWAPAFDGNSEISQARMSMASSQGQSPKPALDACLDACALSAQVSPDSPEPWERRATAWKDWARYQQEHNEDPRPAYEQSRTASKEACRLSPRRAQAWESLALADVALARYLAFRGEDASETFSEALKALDTARDLGASPFSVAMNRGAFLLERGSWERARGIDPWRSYEEAIQACQAAAGLQPGLVRPFQVLGTIYLRMGKDELATGKDPRPSFLKSKEALTKAIALNPKLAILYNAAGNPRLMLAKTEMDSGRDPVQLLDEANRFYSKSIEIDPNLFFPYDNTGHVELYRGTWQAWNGKDPAETFRKGIQFLEKALTLHGDHVETYFHLLDIHIQWALYELSTGRSPDRNLRDAESLLLRTEAANPKASPESGSSVSLRRGQIALVRAVVDLENRRSPVKALADSGKALEQALRLQPRDAEILLALGYHRLVLAHFPGSPQAQKDQSIREADDYLSQAIKLHPGMAEALIVRSWLDGASVGADQSAGAAANPILARYLDTLPWPAGP